MTDASGMPYIGSLMSLVTHNGARYEVWRMWTREETQRARFSRIARLAPEFQVARSLYAHFSFVTGRSIEY